jgi:uncharacterized protein (TIGR02001 family)
MRFTSTITQGEFAMPTISSSHRAFALSAFATLALFSTSSISAAAEIPALSLSANAALVSDYRFRGISLSNKDIAIQGGFDISSESGFYVGTWGSSIEQYAGSETELDVYGGYGTKFGDLSFDIGILAYTYPGSTNTTYWEAYSSVGGSAGKLAWTLGAAYAFDQNSIGGTDNIYLYLDTSMPLADTAFSVATHIAYEDGAFGNEKLDWSLGLTYGLDKFSLGVSYVDTNVNTRGGSAGVIFSLSSSF